MEGSTSIHEELAAARALSVDSIADAIQRLGFECTRCGGCCKGDPSAPHTATTFPDEARALQAATGDGWRDVVRPMPFGLDEAGRGRTYEWALQHDACGDCRFLEEDGDGTTTCSVYDARPLICRTYPFSLSLSNASEPMGAAVDQAGPVVAHECEGLGASIPRERALDLAAALKRRAIRDLEELLAVGEAITAADPRTEPVEVIDSEGRKRPDGTPLEDDSDFSG